MGKPAALHTVPVDAGEIGEQQRRRSPNTRRTRTGKYLPHGRAEMSADPAWAGSARRGRWHRLRPVDGNSLRDLLANHGMRGDESDRSHDGGNGIQGFPHGFRRLRSRLRLTIEQLGGLIHISLFMAASRVATSASLPGGRLHLELADMHQIWANNAKDAPVELPRNNQEPIGDLDEKTVNETCGKRGLTVS